MSDLAFSDEQLKAIHLAEEGKNIFLTGGAGVGKSAVVKEIIRRFNKNRKMVVVLAPTGKAAVNVGGETIHRFFNLDRAPQIADLYSNAMMFLQDDMNRKISHVDLIIIDEISMVRRDIFDVISFKMHNAHKTPQLIVVGDFQQLPPVMAGKGEHSDEVLLKQHYEDLEQKWRPGAYAFHSQAWKDWGFESILLTKVFRQDDKQFIACLNKIALGDADHQAINWIMKNCRKEAIPDCTWICSTNREVDTINAESMAKIDQPVVRIEATITGEDCFKNDADCPVPKILELKEGALVMARINDQNGRFINGSTGIVKKIDLENEQIQVQFSGTEGVTYVGLAEWEDVHYSVKDKKVQSESKGKFRQYPLILAYAVTVHKSQGATLDQVNVKPMCFEVGQLYTMMTRVTSVQNMYIEGKILPKYLKCNADVVRLMQKIRKGTKQDSNKVKMKLNIPKDIALETRDFVLKFVKDPSFRTYVQNY